MKAHAGVDAQSGLVHSVHATAANESDVAHAHALLHGQERHMHADAGYIGVDKREEVLQAQELGEIRKDIKWYVAAKRGSIKAMRDGPLKDLNVLVQRKMAQIRARVEHPFHIIKNLFRYKKLSYRGLRKNAARLYTQFALANLVLAKRALLDGQRQGIGAT
jgi:transposase, IS5 family